MYEKFIKNLEVILKKSGSYAVTIPMEIEKLLKLRKGQKVKFSIKGKNIIIKDWKNN